MDDFSSGGPLYARGKTSLKISVPALGRSGNHLSRISRVRGRGGSEVGPLIGAVLSPPPPLVTLWYDKPRRLRRSDNRPAFPLADFTRPFHRKPAKIALVTRRRNQCEITSAEDEGDQVEGVDRFWRTRAVRGRQVLSALQHLFPTFHRNTSFPFIHPPPPTGVKDPRLAGRCGEIEVSMKQHRNERAGETRDPEKTRRLAESSGTILTCDLFFTAYRTQDHNVTEEEIRNNDISEQHHISTYTTVEATGGNQNHDLPNTRRRGNHAVFHRTVYIGTGVVFPLAAARCEATPFGNELRREVICIEARSPRDAEVNNPTNEIDFVGETNEIEEVVSHTGTGLLPQQGGNWFADVETASHCGHSWHFWPGTNTSNSHKSCPDGMGPSSGRRYQHNDNNHTTTDQWRNARAGRNLEDTEITPTTGNETRTGGSYYSLTTTTTMIYEIAPWHHISTYTTVEATGGNQNHDLPNTRRRGNHVTKPGMTIPFVGPEAFTLTACAIVNVMKGHCEELRSSIASLEKFHKQLINQEIKPEAVINESGVTEACGKIDNCMKTLESSSRTSKLWISLLKCIDLILQFIYAERTGDWDMHLDTTVKMLPFSRAARHLSYSKYAHLYVQQVININSKLTERELEFLSKKGLFTATEWGWKLEFIREAGGERKALKPLTTSKPFALNEQLYLAMIDINGDMNGNTKACKSDAQRGAEEKAPGGGLGVIWVGNSSGLITGAAVMQRLECSSPTKATRVRFSVWSHPDFHVCLTMLLFGGFSRGSPVSAALALRHCSIFSSLHPLGSQYLAVKCRPNLSTHLTTGR
ncbi:hypothetical protein PR048_007852 [Dryococelus australis]|uniref:Uncharacterized protein n=1 Tax=Dryococelus australis TaxID=614101 RepID=A0ABQ9HVE8_9NEOP|nr:hypothetical protein PR048_007852 [Dryococelus australis]